MNKMSLFCCLLSGLLAGTALGEAAPAASASRVATQAEIDKDGFLQSMARELRKSDIVLVIARYKIVETDQGETHYGRVIQSLRGDIPVEALIKWSGYANKLPAGSAPKTELYSSCTPVYVLASSKNVKELEKDPEDFQPASIVYASQVRIGAYDLGNKIDYFPMTESDPGRAMQKLLRIEPARIAEESEAARFQPEPAK